MEILITYCVVKSRVFQLPECRCSDKISWNDWTCLESPTYKPREINHRRLAFTVFPRLMLRLAKLTTRTEQECELWDELGQAIVLFLCDINARQKRERPFSSLHSELNWQVAGTEGKGLWSFSGECTEAKFQCSEKTHWCLVAQIKPPWFRQENQHTLQDKKRR